MKVSAPRWSSTSLPVVIQGGALQLKRYLSPLHTVVLQPGALQLTFLPLFGKISAKLHMLRYIASSDPLNLEHPLPS